MIAGSLLLMLVTAMACINFLNRDIEQFQHLLDRPVKASQLIGEANLEFKTQLQEWKNVLLRGHQAERRERYWAQFETQEARVQAILGELLTLTAQQPALADQIERLRSEHRSLGQAYRKGLDSFIAANADPIIGDAAVAGIDRATSEQMNELVEQLAQSAASQSDALSAEADSTALLGPIVMLLASVLVAVLSLWLVNRRIVKPIGILIEHIAQLSQGRIGARVDASRADELGRLAAAANILRDFLADTFAHLQRDMSNLDSASSELHGIAA